MDAVSDGATRRGYWNSPNTVAAYRRDLQDFFEDCDRSRLNPLSVSRAGVIDYLAELTNQVLSPSTVSRRLVALRGLYDLAVTGYGLQRVPRHSVQNSPSP